VGDAKWKRLEHKKTALGIDAGDAYQLMAYMTRTEIESGVFFFPKTERSGSIVRQHCFESLADRKTIIAVEVDVESLITQDLHKKDHIDRILRGLFEDLVRSDMFLTA
jgi:5-methylcytosine-specific restriction endonuclease McrBC regulatory subunit McrC